MCIPEGSSRSGFSGSRPWDGDVCTKFYWGICLRTTVQGQGSQDWPERDWLWCSCHKGLSQSPGGVLAPRSSQLSQGRQCFAPQQLVFGCRLSLPRSASLATVNSLGQLIGERSTSEPLAACTSHSWGKGSLSLERVNQAVHSTNGKDKYRSGSDGS